MPWAALRTASRSRMAESRAANGEVAPAKGDGATDADGAIDADGVIETPAADRSPFEIVAEGPAPADADVASAVAQESPRPLNDSVDALRERFAEAVLRNEVCAGDQDVAYVDPARIVDVLRWLHDDPQQRYDHLADLTAVDHGGGRPLQVVYQLWSIPHRKAFRIKCELPLDALEIDSATAVWQGADWLEREVFDLFGIRFRGHPDLRRILMPENYAEGYPLRKDFPLRGRFSRAEQTRRALTQDPEDYYAPGEIAERVPQLADAGAPATAGSSAPGVSR